MVENWRQKIERSVSLTRPQPPPGFFVADFVCLILATWNPCSRRRRARTFSLSASTTAFRKAPVWSRIVYAKVGIGVSLRLPPHRRRRLRRLHHLLQLVRVHGAGDPFLVADTAALVEVAQRLVHRLHADIGAGLDAGGDL